MGKNETDSAEPKTIEEAVLKIVYPLLRKYRYFSYCCASILAVLVLISFCVSLYMANTQLKKLKQDINNISTTTKTNLLQIMPTWNRYVIKEATIEELILTIDTFEKMKSLEGDSPEKSVIDVLILALNDAAGKRLRKVISSLLVNKLGKMEKKIPLNVVELSLKTDTATEQPSPKIEVQQLSFVVLESWTATPLPQHFQSKQYELVKKFGLYRYNASDNKGNFIHAITVGPGIDAGNETLLAQLLTAARQIQNDAFIWRPKKPWTGGDELIAPQP